MTDLNNGLGLCKVEGRLALTLSTAAAQLGAAPDALRSIFSAVHSVNRRAKADERAALVLPELSRGYGIAMLGQAVEIFGSEAILADLLMEERIQKLKLRGMLSGRLRIMPVDLQPGAVGCFLARTRKGEDKTSAAAERQARRDARRAEHIAATAGAARGRPAVAPTSLDRDCFLRLDGGLVMHMARGQGIWTGAPVEVCTYGLSRSGTPCILPSMPVGLKVLDAAA